MHQSTKEIGMAPFVKLVIAILKLFSDIPSSVFLCIKDSLALNKTYIIIITLILIYDKIDFSKRHGWKFIIHLVIIMKLYLEYDYVYIQCMDLKYKHTKDLHHLYHRGF